MKGIHNYIHLNLSIALLLALVIFVSGIETANDTDVSILLSTTSISLTFLHYRSHVKW